MGDDLNQAQVDAMFGGLDLLHQRTTSAGFPAPTGSELADDDQASAPYQISHQFSRYMSVAVDHLHVLRCLILDLRTIHIYAPFTLLRGSIENALSALWLISGSTRSERVTRNLRLMWKGFKDGNRLAQEIGATPGRTMEQRRERIQGIARLNGIAFDTIFKAQLNQTTIVDEAGRVLDDASNAPKLAWRIGSGVAHGDSWALVSVYDLSTPIELADGVSGYQITAPTQTLVDMTSAANALLRLTVSRYEQYAKPAAELRG